MQGSNLCLLDLGMTTQGYGFKRRKPRINAPVSHLKILEPGVNAWESYFPAQGAGPLKQPNSPGVMKKNVYYGILETK